MLARKLWPWFRREFLTPRKIAFKVVFHGLHLFFFIYGWWTQYTNHRLAALNTLKYSVWISRGAGLVLAFDGGLILIPLFRNIIRVIRPGLCYFLPVDQNIWFHKQVAYSMAFWSTVHTTAHYVNFINIERSQIRKETALDIHYKQAPGITGHFMLFVMLIMYTTAHEKIRRQCFEAFWYTHHLAFFFLLALYSHATGCFVRDTVEPDYTKTFPFYSTQHCLGYYSWRFIIWPMVIYFGERVWREIRARRATRLSRVLVHPSGAMELRIIKPSLRYVPGQWIFIQVPDVSSFQWHPFTITSAPDDPYISVHIRQVGDWTQALGERLGAGPSVVAAITSVAMRGSVIQKESIGRGNFVEVDPTLMSRELPVIRIDGPYGAPSQDFSSREVAVLIGAGIGVTPFASILKHIWYRQKKGEIGSLRRVEFFWLCRDAPSFGWFQSLLYELEAAQADPNFLRINIYLTQHVSEDMLWNIAIHDEACAYDPLTLLRTRTMFGRPNWNNVFGKMREAIENGSYFGETKPPQSRPSKTTVGTYFCGPGMLAKEIQMAAQGATTDAVRFTSVKERF